MTERPCFACGHIHDPKSPGKCWEAACLPDCPEDHNDFEGVFPYTPDDDAVSFEERMAGA